jgi:hypothetical protein
MMDWPNPVLGVGKPELVALMLFVLGRLWLVDSGKFEEQGPLFRRGALKG